MNCVLDVKFNMFSLKYCKDWESDTIYDLAVRPCISYIFWNHKRPTIDIKLWYNNLPTLPPTLPYLAPIVTTVIGVVVMYCSRSG